MATAVSPLSTLQEFFAGEGDVLVFDTPTDYTTAKLETLANPKSIGNVLQGSTGWTGDDITINPIKNEQGVAVISTTESGTISFELTAMSTDPEMIKKFLGAVDIATTWAAGGLVPTGSKAQGFGHTLAVNIMPFAIVNQTKDKMLILPKASISSTPEWVTEGNGLMGIKMAITAEFIDTQYLKPAMILSGKVNYTTAP